jgi:glycosyltransferase involved in cell wall biosynthesis
LATEARKILIVSYAYPRPGAGWGGVVGGERMRQFAKHLPAHGIETCILTHCGRTPIAFDDKQSVYAAVDSTRWLMEALRPSTNERVARQPVTKASAVPQEGWRLSDLRTRARRFMLPDRASFAWGPFAFARGVQVFERERPQLVLSSSPPLAAHVVAAALAERFGVPWIADVRDGYAFEAPEGPSPLRNLRRSLERQLYARAARLITVTDALRDHFRSFLPQPPERTLTLENGYEAALFSRFARPLRAADDPWTILYAGSTSFGAGRDLTSLLRGIDRFSEHAPQPVRARLMGLFAASELPPLQHTQIELTGWRRREEVVQSMLAADVLIVLTGNHKSVATTKLFEYIGAGRPILVVGRSSAAARIVEDYGLGVVVDDDPERIGRALEALYAERERWHEKLSSNGAQRTREAFSREGQAAVLAAHIHALIG